MLVFFYHAVGWSSYRFSANLPISNVTGTLYFRQNGESEARIFSANCLYSLGIGSNGPKEDPEIC